MEARCAEVAAQQQQAVSDVQALRDALTAQELAAHAARARADAAEVKAAAAERKLVRAREGGRQVAGAAQNLQDQLAAAGVCTFCSCSLRTYICASQGCREVMIVI